MRLNEEKEAKEGTKSGREKIVVLSGVVRRFLLTVNCHFLLLGCKFTSTNIFIYGCIFLL